MIRRSILVVVVVFAGLAPVVAWADVQQPNGQTVPTGPGCDGGNPTGLLATFACVCDEPGVCNIGERCDPGLAADSCPDQGLNATCESRMWHRPNDDPCIPVHHDGLDPVADAATDPQTFVPTCPLTFTVITRGTALFDNAFGWYNVTDAAPGPSDLHVMLDCGTPAGSSVVLDVRNDPAWDGGEIGFFLLTPEDRGRGGACAGGDCCASIDRFEAGSGYVYYSERRWNPEADPFVHLLVYDSQAWERKFYFAWEDTYNAPNNDFTDLVTAVEGVECSGAGVDCETGEIGACGLGVQACEGGTLTCVSIRPSSAERCNGVDDDCDGETDDAAPCDDAYEICVNGECVPDCTLGEEFACPIDYACDLGSGVCVEEPCMDVACPEGEVCRGGACVGACEGVVCPHGQTCTGDRCVDLCANAGCAVGEVCDRGVCLPGCNQCNGMLCAAGLGCDEASGACVDPSCGAGCPEGTYCQAGECLDACDGAVGPRGQSGVAGQGGDGGGGGGDADGAGDGDGPGGDGADGGGADASCACRAAGVPSGGPDLNLGRVDLNLGGVLLGGVLLGLAGILVARRVRRPGSKER